MVLIAFNAQDARPALPADEEPGKSRCQWGGGLRGPSVRGWVSVGIAGNEIPHWEARTASGVRLIDAGVAPLRYRRLSRHLRRDSVGAAAPGGRAPTAASPRSRGRRGLPGGSLPWSTWPRMGTGSSAIIDFTGIGAGEKELREVMDARRGE